MKGISEYRIISNTRKKIPRVSSYFAIFSASTLRKCVSWNDTLAFCQESYKLREKEPVNSLATKTVYYSELKGLKIENDYQRFLLYRSSNI